MQRSCTQCLCPDPTDCEQLHHWMRSLCTPLEAMTVKSCAGTPFSFAGHEFPACPICITSPICLLASDDFDHLDPVHSYGYPVSCGRERETNKYVPLYDEKGCTSVHNERIPHKILAHPSNLDSGLELKEYESSCCTTHLLQRHRVEEVRPRACLGAGSSLVKPWSRHGRVLEVKRVS